MVRPVQGTTRIGALRRPRARAEVADAVQHRVLETLEAARNYNAWIASLARPYLGSNPVEVGSGTGTLAALWLEAGLPRLTVSEVDRAMLGRLRRRFDGDPRVVIEEIDLEEPPAADHSAVVGLNVLEHVADDVGGLRAAARLVRPGGAVLMFVPAFPFAMSDFDRSIGHHRRYTARTIRRALLDAGLEVEVVRYVNAPGLVAWIVGMRLLGLSPHDGPVLRAWDRVVVPVARALEQRRPPPFGQSLLAVGRTAM
jgi:SAM-dependent methyltransferase